MSNLTRRHIRTLLRSLETERDRSAELHEKATSLWERLEEHASQPSGPADQVDPLRERIVELENALRYERWEREREARRWTVRLREFLRGWERRPWRILLAPLVVIGWLPEDDRAAPPPKLSLGDVFPDREEMGEDGTADVDLPDLTSWTRIRPTEIAGRLEGLLTSSGPFDVDRLRARAPLAATYLYPSDLDPNPHERRLTERMLQGEFRPHRTFEWREMGLPPPWDENPEDNRTWDFYRHSLEWLKPVITVGYADDRPAARKLAVDVIEDWATSNGVVPGMSEHAWFDHSVAIRLRLLCWFWEIYRQQETVDAEFARLVYATVYHHAEYICDDDNYNARSNHGLELVGAMLAAAESFPDFQAADRWQTLGLERLRRYAGEAFSPEGFNREQSPSYHWFVLQRLAHVVTFLEANGVEPPQEVTATLRNGIAVWPHLLRPDLSLPRFGDSSAAVNETMNEEIRDLVGMDVPPAPSTLPNPRSDDSSFLLSFDAGYALFSAYPAGERQPEHDTHLAFKCNYFEYPHFHHDGLSFLLYAFGREWFIDAGLFSYEWERPERRYVKSSRAHSVVLVDGEDFGVEPVQLVDHGRTARGDYVTVRHERPEVHHTRTVRFEPPYRVVIEDSILSVDGEPHTVEQLFHAAPDLDVDLGTGGAELVSPDGSTCTIEAGDDSAGTWDLVVGQREPELQGWVSPRFDEFEPAPVVVRKLGPSRQLELETVIDLRRDG